MITKKSLRTEMLALRRIYAGAEAANAEIIKHIQSLGQVPLAGYAPMRGEADVLSALAHAGCGLPVVQKNSKVLKFMEWRQGEALAAGAYGIPEPVSRKEISPEIILVPLLAFDASGHRLGYGGGYYDATIKEFRMRNPQVKVYGIAYNIQEVPALPHEPHDAKLDAVITEIGIRHFV